MRSWLGGSKAGMLVVAVALSLVLTGVTWSTNDPSATKVGGAVLAKFEPASGCYLGAFIDFDLTLDRPYVDQNGRTRQCPTGFEEVVGKPHAMYFFYMGYGVPLPLDWVCYLRDKGKFVHIALEPNQGLDKVRDDEYLRNLADTLRMSEAKVFLRFASEMNGNWVRYHGNPKLYVEKFRLVARVMRERAPNVAMVWCPYATPTSNIPSYYPGDDAVDWVGVNLYNVTHNNNDRSKPAGHISPLDLLRYVYDRYSACKPIMICEYGVTHRSATMATPVSEFAQNRIITLYRALATKYTRVKAINYFNGNNMDAVPHRAFNDYSVTNDPIVLAAYRRAIDSPHFLTAPPGVIATLPKAAAGASDRMVTVLVCADSKRPATAYCPEAVPRQFRAGSVPTKGCHLHRP